LKFIWDIEHYTLTKYAFEGEGPEDLCKLFFLNVFDGLMVVVCLAFSENVIIIANPSKSGGDWWYGKNVSTGKSGLFPKTYVNVVKPCKSLSIPYVILYYP